MVSLKKVLWVKLNLTLKNTGRKYALAGGAVAGAVGGKYAYDKYNEKRWTAGKREV